MGERDNHPVKRHRLNLFFRPSPCQPGLLCADQSHSQHNALKLHDFADVAAEKWLRRSIQEPNVSTLEAQQQTEKLGSEAGWALDAPRMPFVCDLFL